MNRKPLHVAVVALLLFVAGGFATSQLSPRSAFAQGKQTLVGKKVTLLFQVRGGGVDQLVSEVEGTTISSDGGGVWINTTQRCMFLNTKYVTKPYKAKLYVPWSSLVYVKVYN